MGTTTADRMIRAQFGTGATVGRKINWTKIISVVLLVLVILVTFSALVTRWESIGTDVAHCQTVAAHGASDTPEAIRCAGVLG
jgi:hypothetical protein